MIDTFYILSTSVAVGGGLLFLYGVHEGNVHAAMGHAALGFYLLALGSLVLLVTALVESEQSIMQQRAQCVLVCQQTHGERATFVRREGDDACWCTPDGMRLVQLPNEGG